MVNIFWLHDDPVASAAMYCDQHMKIHSEIAESAWDVVRAISPSLYAKATIDGIGFTWRQHRHSGGVGKGHMHPLPRWMALCRSNFREALLRAVALVDEHLKRFGTVHSVKSDVDWLVKHCKELDFQTSAWNHWFQNEVAGINSKKQPYREWFVAYGYCTERMRDGSKSYVWERNDRNVCAPTHFPQIMDDDKFPGCRTPENAVEAARKHYILKAGGEINGFVSPLRMKQNMRFLHSAPPDFLVESGVALQLQRKVARAKSAIKRKVSLGSGAVETQESALASTVKKMKI